MTPANIYVTDHALLRWRERVATYGDATPDEIVAAVRAATPVRPNEPLPLPARRANSRYYRHRDRPSVYFVTDMRPDGEAVVTVIETEPPAPAPAPALEPPETEPEPVVSCGPAEIVGFIPLPSVAPRLPAGGEPMPDEPDDFPDAGARRDWLVARQHEAEAALRAMRRDDPGRAAVQARFRAATRRLTETREAYRAWLAAREEYDGEGIYRDDGRINYEPAIRHLLAEVARLSEALADNDRLRALALALADRVSAQSEILTRRAAGRGAVE